MPAPKHFLRIPDLEQAEAHALVDRALEMKRSNHRGHVLDGKVVVLLFEKASTRTRVSFEVGVRQLGGSTLFMTQHESQLGRSEPLKDTARVLSRYVDCLVVRTFGQTVLDELSHYAHIPVVNALSDEYHPCQVMSDLLTMYERTGTFEGVRVAWVGDGNNMAHSWINASIYFPFELTMAFPEGYDPDPNIVAYALSQGARLSLFRDPEQAVDGAHFVNSDVWASMGQESERKERERVFSSFQISHDLLAVADRNVKVMHCLPAHRGEEITDEVMESDMALIWDQSENRLHMQKAILEWLFT